MITLADMDGIYFVGTKFSWWIAVIILLLVVGFCWWLLRSDSDD
jgi:dolichyl-phosphate-mannose--protein O-mannosyl transferase